MKAVWLSSTYYLDPAIASLPHADAERLFTRALAYCGAAETRGFVPKSVLKTFGIRAVSKRVSELISAGIWVETDTDSEGRSNPGYRFKAWANWNGTGDDLLERRKADRERQRRARDKKAQQSQTVSRDTSRDVTPPEESRGEENKNDSRDNASPVSDARAREAADVDLEAALAKPGPVVDIDGRKLVRSVIPDSEPAAVRTELALQASAMLRQDPPIPAEDIRAGLKLWLSKPELGPRSLPSLVSTISRGRNAPAAASTPSGPRLAASDRKQREQAAVFEEVRRRATQPATQSPLIQIVDAEPFDADVTTYENWTETA
ncbi:hypothetical protein IU443_28415 [Nocardia farcinica]|uniref:hypothetical protein n=1 Tax=Nocardia farcinica TaxID=37329 RepID=UPI0009D29FD5|nr:hypothetical protein [Nocardia farcinica]MBF6393856.1 hypothetical protein [Nocardia farcinica]SLG32668.1 Uncharacterised protein [Mycobacteroides abscessus subsp. abscessus]